MVYSTSIRKMPEALKNFIADWSPITQLVLDMLEDVRNGIRAVTMAGSQERNRFVTDYAGIEASPAVDETDGTAGGAREEEVPFGFYF